MKILMAENVESAKVVVTKIPIKSEFDLVTIVGNGVEAVEQAKKQMYDLILIDIDLPIKNGFDAIKEIRLIPGYAKTIILGIMFSNKNQEDKNKYGINDFIYKPVDEKELIKKIIFYFSGGFKSL